jgi:predicted transposase YdaD
MGSRKPVRLTFIDKYIQQGERQGEQRAEQRGEQRGKAEMLLRLIQAKFGPPSPEVETRIERAEREQLDHWSVRVLTAQSTDELFG